MMFIILDRDPVLAAKLLVNSMPKQFSFKQLIELGQLICGAGISDAFGCPKGHGKELREWIIRHPNFTYQYFNALYVMLSSIIGFKLETTEKIIKVKNKLASWLRCYPFETVDNIVWRYANSYHGTCYKTNSLLCPTTAIREYRKYMVWKAEQFKLNHGWESDLSLLTTLMQGEEYARRQVGSI